TPTNLGWSFTSKSWRSQSGLARSTQPTTPAMNRCRSDRASAHWFSRVSCWVCTTTVRSTPAARRSGARSSGRKSRRIGASAGAAPEVGSGPSVHPDADRQQHVREPLLVCRLDREDVVIGRDCLVEVPLPDRLEREVQTRALDQGAVLLPGGRVVVQGVRAGG